MPERREIGRNIDNSVLHLVPLMFPLMVANYATVMTHSEAMKHFQVIQQMQMHSFKTFTEAIDATVQVAADGVESAKQSIDYLETLARLMSPGTMYNQG